MQASSTTTTTTTKTKKLSNSAGSSTAMSSSKTTTTTTTTRKPATAAAAAAAATSAAAASPKSPKAAPVISSDAHDEIAELSKKINEHADAIYHTWKSRGLPPAQLLEMYTNAAATGDFADVAVAAATTTTDLSNAEGLQKMVTSFVNKDKEQRGKTTATGATIATPTPTATATSKAGKTSQVETLQSPKKVAAVSAKTLPDVNLNYDINLQLDVNNLSQQQTQYLVKISELLQKESATATTTPAKKRQSSNNSSSKTGNSSNSLSNNSNKLAATGTAAAAAAAKEQQPTKKLSKAISSNDVVDAPHVGVAVMNATAKGASETSIATRKVSKTKENNSEQQKPATTTVATAATAATITKEKPTITRKLINSSSSSSGNSNRSNTDNNNASNIVTNATATATATATAAESPATLADTTMPTLNKIKPTSGSRAPLTNGQDKNLGRPILTRGSVAERVMLFEKRPDGRNSFLDIKRPAEAPPKTLLKVKLHATPPAPQTQDLLQKEIRSTKSVYIPRFYFPHGKPQPTIAMERVIRGILSAFDSFPNNQVTKDELPRILKLCGLPFYWRMPVMTFCQATSNGLVERQRFVEFWKQMNVYCHEAASRFVYIMSRGQRFRSYIVPEDLVPMVQDVVDTHPGLAFLKEATEFHSRYVHTVIARIFYSVNRSWSGKITISELKRSDLLEMISLLEEEEDINQIMAFFSYEHFYVIYCKFWELDKDHDLLINQDDLAKHSDNALSTRIVERIFSGCVTRSDNKKSSEDEPKMSYTDFVWFILSEEDKRTPTAIEYWFRCMDIDGDGALSMYELEYFYEEQQQRMEGIGIECLPFEDCLCQMLDMIKPANRDSITLGDLKRCKMTHVFFDTFFNLEKYLDHEQRDPFAAQRDESNTDWDRFAAQEYELLISEEND
ncbi:GH16618 [Drosophila grimshawi]|uniref:GH16618 n=1 Tax=Drosophila grimshawi TaxID=7222 RepID=B4JT05_DROGR|nr:GH16618 [Drosophila grimshawi]